MMPRTRIHRAPMMWLATHVALATATVAPALATPPTNLRLNSPDGLEASTQVDPVVRSTGRWVVAAWTSIQTTSSVQRIHYAVSSDSGATFLDYGAWPPPPVGWRWGGDPELAVSPDGNSIFAVGQVSAPTSPNHLGLAAMKGTPSGGFWSWTSPTVFLDIPNGILRRYDGLSLDCAPDGSLHVLYAPLGSVVQYLSSDDGAGTVWSPPVTLSSLADQGAVDHPNLVVGADGVIHAAWAGLAGTASRPIRYRSHTGLGWEVEQTVATMRYNPTLPNRYALPLPPTHPDGFSMDVNRVAGSTTFGRVAFAWPESWDFADESFPALTGTVIRNELEPNDDASGSLAFGVGDALQGTLSSVTDVDFWSMTLTAGQPVLVWGDSAAVGLTVQIRVIDTDGLTTIANGYSGATSTVFAFSAPRAGTYHLLVKQGIGAVSNSFYRVRTRAGAPAPGEARDIRDIAIVHSTPGGWSSPARHDLGPVGYDDYRPALGFGADGLDYVTWYDMSRGGGFGCRSHLVVARNLAGDDPVFAPPRTVTDAVTDWNLLSLIIPPSIGTSNDLGAGSRRVHLAWMDGRDGTPDVDAASFATTVALGPCPSDTMVTPGAIATVRIGLLNLNPLFEEIATIQVSASRSWYSGGSSVRDSVPPGAGTLFVPITVPDTAAAGVVLVTLTATRQSGLPLGGCQLNLTVGAPLSVTTGPPHRFALDPVTPNPGRGAERVGFTLASPGPVRIAVYGIQGNLVRTLASGWRPAGPNAVHWDGLDHTGRRVAAGFYVVRLEAAGYHSTRPLVVLK